MGAAPAGNWPSSSGPAQRKAAGTGECPHRAGSWEERELGPGPESGTAPTGTSSSRSSLVLGQAALVRKYSWPRGEWGPGEKGRHGFASNPGGGMGSTPGEWDPPESRAPLWGEEATCGVSHRGVCGTSTTGRLDRAPLHGGEKGSWRRRPRAMTERGRTDTCWQLVVTASTLGAFFRLCSPLPTAPSISGQVWVRAQERRTQILNCTLSRCRNLPKAYTSCVGSGSSLRQSPWEGLSRHQSPGRASLPG